MSTTLVRGDRVKVTLDGEVLRVIDIEPGSEEIELRVESEHGATYVYAHPSAIEKVEPPVEVFGPGDLVRSKEYGFLYAIARDGYLSLEAGLWAGVKYPFTSERYERVDLS